MGFAGFNAILEATSPELSINSRVKYSKVGSVDLRNEVKIIMRSKSGKLVRRASFDALKGEATPFNYRYVDEEGKEISKTNVLYYIVNDGEETEVKPYKRSDTIRVEGIIPAEREHEFLIESIYEVFSENSTAIWNLVNYLKEKNALGLAKFSFGAGFKQYIAILKPIVNGDKFILTMNLAFKKKDYKNLMTVPSGTVAETLPTLENVLSQILEKKKVKV